MAKYLVETYYTCNFKVSHYLDDINETELSNLEKRDDGKFEILDVKLDTRKTKNLNPKNKNTDNKKIDIIYLLGADEIDTTKLKNSFIIYQGHHGGYGSKNADIILPGSAFTEKNSTFVNLEGRPQNTFKCCNPPGDAKEDWKIINAIAKKHDIYVIEDAAQALGVIVDDRMVGTYGDFGIFSFHAQIKLTCKLMKNGVICPSFDSLDTLYRK